MGRAKKIIIIVAVAAAVLIAGGFIFIKVLSRGGLPDYNAKMVLKGLKGDVVVYRDRYAVPHIYAQNDDDLYMATGYVMAQDRLWQMDLLRRVTLGRLSEIFGEKLVDADVMFRSLRIPEKSKYVLRTLPPATRKAAEMFALGVNRYLEENPGRLPIEFKILGYRPEKWEAEHSANLIGYMAWDLSYPWSTEVLLHQVREKVGERLFKEIAPDVTGDTPSIPGHAMGKILSELNRSLAAFNALEGIADGVFSASNNWAVAGKKSATGKPLFANDMHLGLNAPGIWIQIHQCVENGLNVTGVALPGQPFVVAGHNSDIAWGMTNVGVDDLDFYIEKVSPDRPDQYLYRGAWKKMEVRREVIAVKGGKKVERTLRFTHRGPVISEMKKLEGMTVSMRWLGNEMEKDNVFRSIYLLNRAKDWDGFRDALTSFLSTSQNINYADTKGNIGIYCAAGIPVRMKGDGMALSPGWTGEYEWKGIVPFDRKPNSYNPPSGFVSSANNLTVGPSYKHHISRWGFALPYRIDRINELLKAKEKFSVDDFKKLHLDVGSAMAGMMLGELTAELKKAPSLNDKERGALALLEKWDGAMEAESPAASIFDTFVLEFLKESLADEMGDELSGKFLKERGSSQHAFRNLWRNKQSAWFDKKTTAEKKETFSDIVLLSFSAAVKRLDGLMGGGPEKWRWGKVHTLTLAHPLGSVKLLNVLFKLNRGPHSLGGSYHTIPQFAYKNEAPFAVVHGPSQRHIYDLSDWDKSLTIIPTGNSGIPASRHYCDQTDLYVKGEYHPDYFSRETVEKNAAYTMKLRAK